MDCSTPPAPPESPEALRSALQETIERLPEEAVGRLWRFVWSWLQGPGAPAGLSTKLTGTPFVRHCTRLEYVHTSTRSHQTHVLQCTNRSFVDIARLIRSPRQAGVKELGACTPLGDESAHT